MKQVVSRLSEVCGLPEPRADVVPELRLQLSGQVKASVLPRLVADAVVERCEDELILESGQEREELLLRPRDRAPGNHHAA